MRKLKLASIYLMSFAYISVGITHFIFVDSFLSIMPPYIPWHLGMIYISGLAEIILGLLLLFKKYRFFAAWGLIILLIAVFPANIYLAQSEEAQLALKVSYEAALIRLPFQVVFILFAYWHRK